MYTVEIKNVIVEYNLKNNLNPFKRSNINNKIKALNDITLSIKEGSTIAIVGRNGSGKSTLLRILSKVMKPTSGNVVINGSISTVLGIGVGFNKNLSGRDNIYLGGYMQGLSKKDIDNKIDSIIQFADIGEFIDIPISKYSLGMYQRIAFASAIYVKPDILIIDEGLSTGDESFKHKAHDAIKTLINRTRTVIIVSHELEILKEITDKAIWLDKGSIRMFDNTDKVISEYKKFSDTLK